MILRHTDPGTVNTQFRTTHTPDAEGFLQARHIRDRYRITDMTIHRWLRDERVAFPKPIYIGRLRYWRRADIETWEQAQGRAA